MTVGLAPRDMSVRAHRTAWTLGPTLWLTLVNGGGALLVLLGWWGTSGSVRLPSQVAWLNVAVLGVVATGCGNAVWLLAGRRAIGERRATAHARIRRVSDCVLEPVAHGRATVASDDGILVSRQGMTRYHREDCPLVAGKSVKGASEKRHHEAGRRPCGVCRP